MTKDEIIRFAELVAAAEREECARVCEEEITDLRTALAERDELLAFIERWANHHAPKPNMTAEEALSVIQHHPSIKAITKKYADGKVPNTFDPYAELTTLRAAAQQALEWFAYFHDEGGTAFSTNVQDTLTAALK